MLLTLQLLFVNKIRSVRGFTTYIWLCQLQVLLGYFIHQNNSVKMSTPLTQCLQFVQRVLISRSSFILTVNLRYFRPRFHTHESVNDLREHLSYHVHFTNCVADPIQGPCTSDDDHYGSNRANWKERNFFIVHENYITEK